MATINEKNEYNNLNEFEQSIYKVWKEKNFRMGIPIIDLQHLWLIHLILKIDDYSKGDMARDLLANIIQQTIDFAIEHFSTEEKLIDLVNFPNSLEHVRNHRNYIEQIKYLNKKSSQSIYTVASRIQTLMYNWLNEHIKKHDFEYKAHIDNSEIDIYKLNHELVSHTNISREQVQLYQKITNDYTIKNEIINKNLIDNIRDIWKTYNLALNIPILDMQHLWLIKLFVELDLAVRTMTTEERSKIFQKTLLRSLEYAKEHFSTEELLMKKLKYPGFPKHSEKHSYFISFLRKRNEECKRNDSAAPFNLVQDLKNWLFSHIALDDKSLKNFFQKDIITVHQLIKHLNAKGLLKVHNGQVALYQEFYKKK